MRLFTGIVAAAVVGPALAQTPPDVADLVGLRAGGGEIQLEARGYHFVTANTVRETKFSFWYNGRRQQCLSVATNDGRYAAIDTVPPANCDAPGGGATGADFAGREATDDRRGDDGRADGRNDRRGVERIILSCVGSGSTPAAQATSGYRYNPDTSHYESEFGTTLGRNGFSAALDIEIDGGGGRIRPQGALVSPIHSGGVDGWWPIEGLVVTPDTIGGRYRMNGLNKPQIEYDRRSRVIHVRAATDFTGRCDER